MGRNYIAERTIADPKLRKAAAGERKRKAAKLRAAEQVALAAYLERSKWCKNKCGSLAAGGDQGWWPCCSGQCLSAWNLKLGAG